MLFAGARAGARRQISGALSASSPSGIARIRESDRFSPPECDGWRANDQREAAHDEGTGKRMGRCGSRTDRRLITGFEEVVAGRRDPGGTAARAPAPGSSRRGTTDFGLASRPKQFGR